MSPQPTSAAGGPPAASAAPPASHRTAAAPPDAAPAGPSSTAPTRAEAFDLLHGRHAASLLRQAFLLCGHRGIARRAVAHGFHQAWQHWPDVADDPDPAGRVRAAVHQYALAPWRNWHPARPGRHAKALQSTPPGDRALLEALLNLPRSYRAALLLRDGLGLSLAETAAETEASTQAAASRVQNARTALGAHVPQVRNAAPEDRLGLVTRLLSELAAPQPVSLPPARRARRRSAWRAWGGTGAALGLVAAFVTAVVCVLAAPAEDWDLTPPPVPKPPGATLPPAQQPGRLLPMI